MLLNFELNIIHKNKLRSISEPGIKPYSQKELRSINKIRVKPYSQ